MLKNLPIRVKLPLILVSTCVAALLLAAAAFLINQRQEARQNMVRELTIMASIIGNRSTAALVFDDRKLAEENIAVLATMNEIDQACIYRGEAELFASYAQNGKQIMSYPEQIPQAGYSYSFGRDSFDLVQPILLEENQLGFVHIRANLQQYKKLIRRQLLIAFVITGTVALLAFLVSSRLLKKISTPLADLAEMAAQVAVGNDYSLRAPKLSGKDEVSSLVQAVNEMLAQIEKRDSALSDSEKRFRTLVDQAMDAFFLHDMDGRIIDVNNRACVSTGYSREELLGLQVGDIDIQVEPQRHKASFWDNLAAQETVIIEGIHQRKDGTTFPVEIALGKFYMEGKTYLSGLARDISERKQAEEEVARLRFLLSNIIDSMPSALVSVDTEGKVTQWNREAANVTGITTDNALGRNLSDVYPLLAGEMARIRYAIQAREVIEGSRIHSHVDGEARYEDLTIYPLVANGINGAVIRVDDVTGKVRIEEMMVQTEKMMSVGGLAAGMAHEINNPLGVMMHAAQNIERRFSANLPANIKAAERCGVPMGNLSSYLEERRIHEIISEIRQAGERAAKIVANMLQFSRKSESLMQPASLAELIDQTVDLAGNDYDLKKKYDFRQVEILRRYEPELPLVPVIWTELEQVFLNVLKNGAQAMSEHEFGPGEKPRFILTARSEPDMVRVEIEDNGPGMADEVRKRVFEPFFTTKPVGLGTGLGLSVSFMIVVNNHKGSMEVESEPGAGAKFIIRLPLQRC